MSSRAGSGKVERSGRWFYLRRWRKVSNTETGEITREQERVRIGRVTDIRSEAQARKVADAWLARLSPETLQPGPLVTFAEYSERFLADHVGLLRSASRRRYASFVRHLQREFDRETLAEIDTARLQSAITAFAQGHALATVRTYRTIALQILRRARTDGFATHAIQTKDIKLPRTGTPERIRQSFTLAELEQIIQASDEPWSALWSLLGLAGLRVGEGLALCWADINFDERTLRIRRNATRTGLEAPKTQSSASMVPLLPKLDACLRAYRAVWKANSAGLLFATSTGKPLGADNVRSRRLQPLLKRLGLPHAGLHAFRHSTPSILSNMGLSPAVIQRCMRHSTLAMTERYLHTSDLDVHAAIDTAVSRRDSLQNSTEVPQT